MTIIFQHRKDTEFLEYIWKDIQNIKLLDCTKENRCSSKDIRNALYKEKDTIILVGHGDNYGLLYPDFNGYMIDSRYVNFLRGKKIIAIWCFAKEFTTKYNLTGFSTGMFISDKHEAYNFEFGYIDENIIEKENISFALKLNKLLKDNIDYKEWPNILRKELNTKEGFVEFNYNSLISL